jgi:hypothetical protein
MPPAITIRRVAPNRRTDNEKGRAASGPTLLSLLRDQLFLITTQWFYFADDFFASR